MTRQLNRRAVLRAAGAALALPLLDVFAPCAHAKDGPQLDAAESSLPQRVVFLFAPNGVNPAAWYLDDAPDASSDPAPSLAPAHAPLKDLREHVLFLRGLDQDLARAHGDGPGDHARCSAVFLTSAHPQKTAGVGIRVGRSIDQVAADTLGQATRLASLEMGLEHGRRSGSCDSGYSCAYTSHVSWRSPTTPQPKLVDPRRVFERLFGRGVGVEDADARARRVAEERSVLDAVAEQAKRLHARLGTTDRGKIDEYLDSVRSVERSIQQAERLDRAVREKLGDRRAPEAGIPARHVDHARVMADLLVLGLETDATRVITHMFGNGGSNRAYRDLGIANGHHGISHHQGDQSKIAKIRRIDRWMVEQFAYVVQRLATTRERDKTLLDNTLVLFGSAIRDGNRHNHHDLPLLLAGGAGGLASGGRTLRAPKGTPLANLFLSMLDAVGAGGGVERFGDSTGRLPGLTA